MRDQRFIAVHRGGPLSSDDHARLENWVSDCGERVLPLFMRFGQDDRATKAIRIARV